MSHQVHVLVSLSQVSPAEQCSILDCYDFPVCKLRSMQSLLFDIQQASKNIGQLQAVESLSISKDLQ